MEAVTHKQIFEEFCIYNPVFARNMVSYKAWGKSSIVIWLNDGRAFKIKRVTSNAFIMQIVTEEDIKRKFAENK